MSDDFPDAWGVRIAGERVNPAIAVSHQAATLLGQQETHRGGPHGRAVFFVLAAFVEILPLERAVVAVLGAGALIEALSTRIPAVRIDRATAIPNTSTETNQGSWRFLRSVGHVVVRTVPALLIGVIGSMILIQYVPEAWLSSGTFRVFAIAATAALAVPLALPTFFEIPLALGLIAAGAPTGAALALLFAGPAVNLPSLLTLARTTNWKISLSLALSIWTIAVVGGLAVS